MKLHISMCQLTFTIIFYYHAVMNTFMPWQETISDTYLTYTPPCFPFIEPNISLLPQGSLASIPSNALIKINQWRTRSNSDQVPESKKSYENKIFVDFYLILDILSNHQIFMSSSSTDRSCPSDRSGKFDFVLVCLSEIGNILVTQQHMIVIFGIQK